MFHHQLFAFRNTNPYSFIKVLQVIIRSWTGFQPTDQTSNHPTKFMTSDFWSFSFETRCLKAERSERSADQNHVYLKMNFPSTRQTSSVAGSPQFSLTSHWGQIMLLLETELAEAARPPTCHQPTDHNNVDDEHLTPLFRSTSGFTALQSGFNKDVKTNSTEPNRPRLHVQNETNHK